MDVITQMCQERDRARQAAADRTRQLQELMLEHVSAIAAETAKAARLDQMIATLQQGAAYDPEPAQAADQAETEAEARPAPAERMPAPKVSGLVAQVIVDALAKAGAKGLSGTEVNDAVRDAGYTLDASEKNKTRLKNKNLVYHDRKAQHWYLKDPKKASAS